MGTNSSKLKKVLEQGDEAKALEIYGASADLRRRLNANAIINDFTNDTYMHVCAQHGMFKFLKLLLYENNGNPNKLNKHNQTALHKVCQGRDDNVQYECMQLLLQWHDMSTCASNLITKKHSPVYQQQSIVLASSFADLIHKEKEREAISNVSLLTEININAKDDKDNTPLHYASMRNLPTCVQTLVAHGAYLFAENIDHLTPCDLAERNGQKDITLYLESKMIFSNDEDEKENTDDMDTNQEMPIIEEINNYGLRIQDLQKEKDMLLLETSEMLRCSMFIAEIMLKKHAWSKDNLLKSWLEDPTKCCEKCGITILSLKAANLAELKGTGADMATFESASVIARKRSGRYFNKRNDPFRHTFKSLSKPINASSDERTKATVDDYLVNNQPYCGICYVDFVENDSLSSSNDEIASDKADEPLSYVQSTCGHKFCRSCWKEYLTLKIDEGKLGDMVCPQVDCFAIIPNETIERLVSKETAQKLLTFDIKAFVDANPSIKWCPYPGCGMAVRNPRCKPNVGSKMAPSNEIQQEFLLFGRDYSMSVDCGNNHYFCWDCLQEGHAPASCANWNEWQKKILETKPEEAAKSSEKAELSANYLWLVSNSKLCPNPDCNAPIQKNEGCNHVKCYKCRHEFCWICLEPWKKHSSLTGGFFQCNRYEISTKIIKKVKATILEAESAHEKAVELNKFVHYYTRFMNHENSYKIEEPLLAMARTKFEELAAQCSQVSATTGNGDQMTASPSPLAGSSKDSSDVASHNSDSPPTSPHAPLMQRLTHTLEKGVSKLLHNSDLITLKTNSLPNSPSKSLKTTKENKLSCSIENTKLNVELDTQVVQPIKSSHELSPVATVENLQVIDAPPLDSILTVDEPSASASTDSYQFIEDAIRELLKSRRILRCSYVYGYYLDTFGHKKFIFEFIQTEFEESTENLSQIIARPHLKTPKKKIIRLTNMLKRKRLEFLDTITRGLNSFNDTPPTLKRYSRQRWKYFLKDNIQNDDEFKKTIALSLKELNPKNPWIVDKKGRHTNLLALLNDWPELEQELDEILLPSKEKNGLCAKWDCGNPRAVNKLSGNVCNYCSIKCMKADRDMYLQTRKGGFGMPPLIEEMAPESETKSNVPTPRTSTNRPRPKPVTAFTSNRSYFADVPSTEQKPGTTKLRGFAFNNTLSQPIESLLPIDVMDTIDEAHQSTNTDSDLLDRDDIDMIRAIELSKLQQMIDLKNRLLNNTTKSEEDEVQRAIAASLALQNHNDSHIDQRESRLRGGACSSNHIDKVDNYASSKVTSIETQSSGRSEKDIRVIIKNLGNVLGDLDTNDKMVKVCNFPLKAKKVSDKVATAIEASELKLLQ